MSIKKKENHLRNIIKSVTTGSHLSITSEGGICQKFLLSVARILQCIILKSVCVELGLFSLNIHR